MQIATWAKTSISFGQSRAAHTLAGIGARDAVIRERCGRVALTGHGGVDGNWRQDDDNASVGFLFSPENGSHNARQDP